MQLHSVLALGKPLRLTRGDKIYSEGEMATTLFYVREGYIISQCESPSGRELVFLEIGPGDFAALAALVGGYRHVGNGIALTDAHVVAIQASDMTALLSSKPDITQFFLRYTLQRLAARSEQLKELALLDATARIAKLLLKLAQEHRTRSGSKARPEIEISDRMIGLLTAGTSRETVNRTLRAFTDQGIVARKGRHLTMLDLAKLKKVSDGALGEDKTSKPAVRARRAR